MVTLAMVLLCVDLGRVRGQHRQGPGRRMPPPDGTDNPRRAAKVRAMIYELRLYSVAPGRMADVHDRFNHHFPALFARHGVHCVGRWNAVAGPDAPRFVYLMAYRDYAERET